MAKTRIIYVTSSEYKEEESRVFVDRCVLSDGSAVKDRFHFEIRRVPIKEVLEVDLKVMVQAEVVAAYSQIKIPCIVEHAGLVFTDLKGGLYPGGLTKPMWDTLGDRFLSETNSAGRRAVARAVVAYCDGTAVKTFIGETPGQLADKPRGARSFYWDTVFIPDDPGGKIGSKTYAEIVGDSTLGLAHKIEYLSQSSKAMRAFLDYIQTNPTGTLWQ